MPAPDHKALTPNPVSRLNVASRSLAAIGGGYLAANMFVPAFARLVPLTPRDATQAGLMLSFIVFALTTIWAFGCRSPWRAWAGILGLALICTIIVLALPKGAA